VNQKKTWISPCLVTLVKVEGAESGVKSNGNEFTKSGGPLYNPSGTVFNP